MNLDRDSVYSSFVSHCPADVLVTLNPSYGPKGHAIIQSALLRLFRPNKTPTQTFAPLNLWHFTEYVLIPYVASRLIQEDLECSPADALSAMTKSGNVGAALHPEDDESEEIGQSNAVLAGKEEKAQERLENSKKQQRAAKSKAKKNTNETSEAAQVCHALIFISLLTISSMVGTTSSRIVSQTQQHLLTRLKPTDPGLGPAVGALRLQLDRWRKSLPAVVQTLERRMVSSHCKSNSSSVTAIRTCSYSSSYSSSHSILYKSFVTTIECLCE
jgi:hypothetical protein